MKDGDAPFRPMFWPSRVTGIEEQRSANALGERPVRVAEHNHVGVLALDLKFQVVAERAWIKDVMEQKLFPGKFNELCRPVAKARVVRVASNSGDGRDELQFKQNVRHPDVAPVQDMVHALEQIGDARVKKVVRVGDDANLLAGLFGGLCRFRAVVTVQFSDEISENYI